MLIVKQFTANWCQPCKALAPIFNELQNEISEVQFQTIDVDQNKPLALENNVTSIPTVIMEKNGEQVYRFTGVLSKSVIAGIIKKHL